MANVVRVVVMCCVVLPNRITDRRMDNGVMLCVILISERYGILLKLLGVLKSKKSEKSELKTELGEGPNKLSGQAEICS